MGQELGIGIPGRSAQVLVKYLADLFLFFMDAWQDDMTGWLAGQLDDAFAQVGVYHFYTLLLQKFIQMTFFRQHGFALDHLIGLVTVKDRKNNGIVLRCISRPVYGNAIGSSRSFKLLKIFTEIGQHIVLDAGGGFTQLFPFRHIVSSFIPLLPDPPKCLVVPVDAGLIPVKFIRESGMVFSVHNWLFNISAMCLTCTVLFWRCKIPSICIRQLISAPVIYSAP